MKLRPIKFKKFAVKRKKSELAIEKLETQSDFDLDELVDIIRDIVDDDPSDLTPEMVLDIYRMYPRFQAVISKMLPSRFKAVEKKRAAEPKKDEAVQQSGKVKRRIFGKSKKR